MVTEEQLVDGVLDKFLARDPRSLRFPQWSFREQAMKLLPWLLIIAETNEYHWICRVCEDAVVKEPRGVVGSPPDNIWDVEERVAYHCTQCLLSWWAKEGRP